MDDYQEDFVNGDDAVRKTAVKRLTRKIATEVQEMTVNAPDWCVLLGRKEESPADRQQGHGVRCANGERAALGKRVGLEAGKLPRGRPDVSDLCLARARLML
jgi:hypothetical protein